MENESKKKTTTFADWLDLLSQAADGVMSDKVPVEKALTLSRVTDSAMKVITTALNVAHMKAAPPVLTGLIGETATPALLDEDIEMASRHRRELSILAMELDKPGLTPARRAFLLEKKTKLLGLLDE